MTTEVENVLKSTKTEFIPVLIESFGQDLKAVILYGSAAVSYTHLRAHET